VHRRPDRQRPARAAGHGNGPIAAFVHALTRRAEGLRAGLLQRAFARRGSRLEGGRLHSDQGPSTASRSSAPASTPTSSGVDPRADQRHERPPAKPAEPGFPPLRGPVAKRPRRFVPAEPRSLPVATLLRNVVAIASALACIFHTVHARSDTSIDARRPAGSNPSVPMQAKSKTVERFAY